MIEITIDGIRARAKEGEFLLAVARREGIFIPTLCHHDAVEPSGACRLCMVEITRPEWEGWSELVTACLYPVEDGLIVSTDSERVCLCRREVLELLLARSPGAGIVRELAWEYGVVSPKYDQEEESGNCILCDICTRICQTLVTGAISRVNRGVEKKVETPFAEASADCIGCLACAGNCPTDAIEFSDDGACRTIWGKTFEVVPCTVCGAPTMTREQIEWLAARDGVLEEDLAICPGCKAEKTVQAYARIVW